MSVLILASEYRAHRDRKPSKIIELTDRFNGQGLESLINAATAINHIPRAGGPTGQYLMRFLAQHDLADKLDMYCVRLATTLHWSLIDQVMQMRTLYADRPGQARVAYNDNVRATLLLLSGKEAPLFETGERVLWTDLFGTLEMHVSLCEFRRAWMRYRRTVHTAPSELVIGDTQTVAQQIVTNELIKWAPYGDLEDFIIHLTEAERSYSVFKFTQPYANDPMRNMVAWFNTVDAVTFTSAIISYWMYRQKLTLPF